MEKYDLCLLYTSQEILPDKAVRHERTRNDEDEHPFQVVVPPVCPALPAAVLPLFAGLEVLGVNVAFVTVAAPGGGTGVQLQVNLSTNSDKVTPAVRLLAAAVRPLAWEMCIRDSACGAG